MGVPKMSYEIAINKAWEDLNKAGPGNNLVVKFLGDEYNIDLNNKQVIFLSGNIPAKDYTAIIILHYLAKKIKGLPQVTGEWLTFRELSGVEGYAAAFHKRVIEPLAKKYGALPDDTALVVEAFEGVPVMIKSWKADSEFGPDANIYFERNILQIFCIEDIIVLAEMIARKK